MEEHEAGGRWSYKGGDVRGGELVNSFEIPVPIISTPSFQEGLLLRWERIHLIVGPLQLVDEIQAAMDDERVHMACLLTETGDAISALLGSAKFELKHGLVSRSDNAEVIGHDVHLGKENGKRSPGWKGSGMLR